MTFSLSVLFASSLLIPIVASGQMDARESQSREAAPAILAMTASSRAGISGEDVATNNWLIQPDTTEKHISAGTRARHAAVGGLAGIVAGGVIGAAIGAYHDSRSKNTGGEFMIPGFAVGGVLGAAVGLVFGVIIGADWP
jgi:hypothetical protein